MSYKFEAEKDIIIQQVVDKVNQKLQPKAAALSAGFVWQLLNTMALADLQEWDIDDLYGAMINFWSLIEQRAPQETKIRIYNPDFERNGWQNPHTVIEIVTDDMPFLVDSLRMVIHRLGLVTHLMIHMGGLCIKRDQDNQAVEIFARGSTKNKSIAMEAAVFIEIDRQTDHKALEELHRNIEQVLGDNRAVVDDWKLMREKVREAIEELKEANKNIDKAEKDESIAFLSWLEGHHFTFLGIRDYDLVHKDNEIILKPIIGTGLGLLRDNKSVAHELNISEMGPKAQEFILSNRTLIMSKTTTQSTVHRKAYTDYIGIKRFNKKGDVIGERRIIGLYTSEFYYTNPRQIPRFSHIINQIMQKSALEPNSHAAKVLMNILETLPRDDLIQGSLDELLEIAMGIYHMQERPRIRLFGRTDVYRRFVSCLVYIPKERFNTKLIKSMQEILKESFHAKEITFSTWFSESILARIHFIIRIDPQEKMQWDFKEIEQKISEVGRTWNDDLYYYLGEALGEEEANHTYHRYKNAFSSSYIDTFTPRTAVYDIKHIEKLSKETSPLGMNFYRPVNEKKEIFYFKIYQCDNTIALSDVLPIIERLGMRAISERPYVLKFEKGQIAYINEFILHYTSAMTFEVDDIKELFQNAFLAVWTGEAENDGFNQLVLRAGLDWRQVSILRAYAKYYKQIGVPFSQDYIESALNNHPAIARKLVHLFELRFTNDEIDDREDRMARLVEEIFIDLDSVTNLDEDRIIRQYIQVINATIRTNFYQNFADGKSKPYISLKLNSNLIPKLPKPYPLYEIFIYSARFEGIHLRGGKVARGGIRWSDRREDFRTEILGLMKAQSVKNAVIVPTGAKGGFVPKRIPANATREEILAEGIACYQDFIRGLSDLTDNYRDGMVIKPSQVRCYDDDDPYLVVAADKGTATFSDIANAISLENGFWLGDAFASGGSVGYDHKKMGITARGAWESVTRHFYEMQVDISKTNFTVVGIGDMAGDVFGNGMLLSRHIQLVAAFNHLHIFVDPNPDPETSFEERSRLFHLPRSNWTDYERKLISKGGGVFNRTAKSIPVSKEMKQLFKIKQSEIEPNELIKEILKAEVDLLWSAGIGTFVKSTEEMNTDVGDRSNDACRINATQLRCKIVGEGGNLGLTQLARIEYASQGGLIYTDFIDNSAGVNCSDKEVNIKILLNSIVVGGDLTLKQRNELLSKMTDEVAALVLRDNFVQTRAISLTASQGLRNLDLHRRYINELERTGKIDRAVEFIPDEKLILERKLMGKGITTPTMAVLLCYSKTLLKEQILSSNVPEDNYLKTFLISYFPRPLQEQFSKQMENHPLKREIIATKLSNIIVNEMGFAFVFRMQEETGAPVSAIVRAYMIARKVLGVESIFKQIEDLESIINAEKQTQLVMLYVRVLRRVTRWFLRNQRMRLNISKAIKLYEPGVVEMKKALPDILGEKHRQLFDEHLEQFLELGISPSLCHELVITRSLFSAMDIIEVAHKFNLKVAESAQLYFAIGEFLDLGWIRMQIISHPTDNNWEALSREALRDDLDWQQKKLSEGIVALSNGKRDYLSAVKTWSENHVGLITRWQQILTDLRGATSLNYTMYFVAIRELLDLTQTTIQMAEQQKIEE